MRRAIKLYISSASFSSLVTGFPREQERCDRDSKTYLELLVVAGALLARRLELVAHVADLLVDLGVLCGRHFGWESWAVFLGKRENIER